MEGGEQDINASKNPFKALKERAYNTLVMNRIDSIPLFLAYYNRHSNFLMLRHCGAVTNAELIAFAKKLIAEKAAQNQGNQDGKAASSGADPHQDKNYIPDDQAMNIYHGIPQRPKNVLHVNGIFTAEEFINFFLEYGEFTQLRHCGKVHSDMLSGFAEEMLKHNKLKKK